MSFNVYQPSAMFPWEISTKKKKNTKRNRQKKGKTEFSNSSSLLGVVSNGPSLHASCSLLCVTKTSWNPNHEIWGRVTCGISVGDVPSGGRFRGHGHKAGGVEPGSTGKPVEHIVSRKYTLLCVWGVEDGVLCDVFSQVPINRFI